MFKDSMELEGISLIRGLMELEDSFSFILNSLNSLEALRKR